IEEAQEELRIGGVVRGDRPLVGVDLPEQSRLDEAPSKDQRMAVVEMLTQLEGLQHVAFEVDVTVQVSFRDVAFIEAAKRPECPLIAQADGELRLALTECPF